MKTSRFACSAFLSHEIKMRRQAMPGENVDNLQTPREVAEKIKNIIASDKVYKGEVIDLKSVDFN